MDVLLTSAAQKDLTLVIAWYESQQLGLGAEFLRCFDAAIALVQEFHAIGTAIDEHYRRILVSRFPVSI